MQSWAPRLCPIQVTRVGENEVNAYIRDPRTVSLSFEKLGWSNFNNLDFWFVDPLLTLNPSNIEVRDQPAAYQ